MSRILAPAEKAPKTVHIKKKKGADLCSLFQSIKHIQHMEPVEPVLTKPLSQNDQTNIQD